MMPTNVECVCCCEIDAVVSRLQELPIEGTNASCITDHEGFDSVCLNVWVLQTAYFNYREKYGDAEVEKSVHE